MPYFAKRLLRLKILIVCSLYRDSRYLNFGLSKAKTHPPLTTSRHIRPKCSTLSSVRTPKSYSKIYVPRDDSQKVLVVIKRTSASLAQNLLYSSFGVQEIYMGTKSKCSEGHRPKDCDPQKRVVLVLCKPISRFSNFLSRGQTQASTIKGYDARSSAKRLPYMFLPRFSALL